MAVKKTFDQLCEEAMYHAFTYAPKEPGNWLEIAKEVSKRFGEKIKESEPQMLDYFAERLIVASRNENPVDSYEFTATKNVLVRYDNAKLNKDNSL